MPPPGRFSWMRTVEAFLVKLGMLENTNVVAWLGGIEPAWTLLDSDSFNALRHAPSPKTGPIGLAADLSSGETESSAVARNARLLLQAASTGPGLTLTATGNLARSVVADMVDAFAWPGFDRAYEFRFHKVVNEPDFQPLFFIRHVLQGAKCLRKDKGFVKVTPAGRRLLDPANAGALQAVLFHTTFWHLSLNYLARGLHDAWPQFDVGVVLWCLSVAANDWQTRERLTRLCTVPIIGVLEATWDSGSTAMEARILRPLVWFGLLETQLADPGAPRWQSAHLYRKTALFDRFLTFSIMVEETGAARH